MTNCTPDSGGDGLPRGTTAELWTGKVVLFWQRAFQSRISTPTVSYAVNLFLGSLNALPFRLNSSFQHTFDEPSPISAASISGAGNIYHEHMTATDHLES